MMNYNKMLFRFYIKLKLIYSKSDFRCKADQPDLKLGRTHWRFY